MTQIEETIGAAALPHHRSPGARLPRAVRALASRFRARLRARQNRLRASYEISRLDAHLRKDAGLPPADALMLEAERLDRMYRYR
jgi:hypothetical protein